VTAFISVLCCWYLNASPDAFKECSRIRFVLSVRRGEENWRRAWPLGAAAMAAAAAAVVAVAAATATAAALMGEGR
jgi:hypothetical protein